VTGRVLHLLSQRPAQTGSGVTLQALVQQADRAGWEQCAVVGLPAGDRSEPFPELAPDRVRPLWFGEGPLDFPLPGMSDVMPYPSSRFGALSEAQLERYREAWRRHVAAAVAAFRPDLVHSHHLWLLSALVKDVAPALPVVTQCHATGLRQMELVPRLAEPVRRACARNDAFIVLHEEHAAKLAAALALPRERVHVVGAGYREDLFHGRGREPRAGARLLYVGKYSAAKGLPQLLDACEALRRDRPELELQVAGSGAGPEAEALDRRMAACGAWIHRHGQLPQPELAGLMRRSEVCVLPSFYEGLPLVLVEALACGCRLVATALPGIRAVLAPRLGEALTLVPQPAMRTVDEPRDEALGPFTAALERALGKALDAGPLAGASAALLAPFTWAAVFGRVEGIWHGLLDEAAG
jgi:glycosyltransferase involved in cell wall biosynthesis